MKILGFTDSVTWCDLCGKTELKGAFAVETDEGEIKYLGSSCVKKRYGLNQKEFKVKVKEGYNEALKKANNEYEASEEYKAEYVECHPDFLHEYKSPEFMKSYNANKAIDKAKEDKLAEIREKYLIEYKHLNRHTRKYML